MNRPEFLIDVGGTFTDCIACLPDGRMEVLKTLSSGVTKGTVGVISERGDLVDVSRHTDPAGFWDGYSIRLCDRSGVTRHQAIVERFVHRAGVFNLSVPVESDVAAALVGYELSSTEEAPLVAIRRTLGLRLVDPIPSVVVKLGTTRGTNALLTRTGARCALVTTRGFRDVLRIGNQDRPRLFELGIQKPIPLYERVLEIGERIDSTGNVLTPVDADQARNLLAGLYADGIESIAICLLNAYVNADHERQLESIARDFEFRNVSVSSRLSPLIRFVPRADTAVVDAYLNPVLRDYLDGIREPLGGEHVSHGAGFRNTDAESLRGSQVGTDFGSRFQVMTSAGGLVDADQFAGRDSILSGPAGGAIGFSRVAQRAGFPRSIGFDMGGTSTDVSRFDGRWEVEFETVKAGVRIVSPVLPIETVAAGGGSVCGFDGVRLQVGPQSAGADPGPACYGRCGPLTVTDCNLFLGRIVADQFPFALDVAVVRQRLQDLCGLLADSPLGGQYTPVQLAEGFIEIANASMVRAIRRISVGRGFDPRDDVLVTFGGAGGQHACAIARSLRIRTILVHRYAGILSAWGMGLADVRRVAQQSVLKPYSTETLTEVRSAFQRLAKELEQDVLSQGVPSDDIQPPVNSLDLRYAGVEATINVPCPADHDYRRAYEELHRRLYGYVHVDRPIEITAARVEVVGKTSDPPEALQVARPHGPESDGRTRMWIAGVATDVPLFFRSTLDAGAEISGPAIVVDDTSMVVIDSGFDATVTERADLLIHDRVEEPRDGAVGGSEVGGSEVGGSGESTLAVTTRSADPVTLEIFNNLFASIAERMGIVLQKTAVSTNVKERLDFSCAIFDCSGRLVVNAPHIPVHLGAMSETVRWVLHDNPEIAVGDVFVTNDPFRGGSHLPDVTVVSPVHDEQTGELIFLTASRAHHAEIGGVVPGSMPPFSRRLAEEGVLIRNFRLVDRRQSRIDPLRTHLASGHYPSRAVDDNLADIAAQVAANNAGIHALRELVANRSWETVRNYMEFIQDAAAEKMRLALSGIADGQYRLVDHLDDGSPIAVSITIDGSTAVVDFSGTGPVVDSNLNANRAITTAAVLYVFRCLIDDDIPLNGGVLDPVRIVLPECLLNPPSHVDPEHCAAIVGGNVETSQRIVDTLFGALQVAAASQGTMNNLTFGDARFGYYETICGGEGATRSRSGASAVQTHMTNTRLTDPEVIEHRYPLRVLEFSIRTGSGGRGHRAGGDGVIRRLQFLRRLTVSMLSERRGPFAPFGMCGGRDGHPGRNHLQRSATGETIELGGKFSITVEPGDILTIETPGGGGYGNEQDDVPYATKHGLIR